MNHYLISLCVVLVLAKCRPLLIMQQHSKIFNFKLHFGTKLLFFSVSYMIADKIKNCISGPLPREPRSGRVHLQL